MCLAVPARVVAVHENEETATVALGKIEKKVSIALLDGVRTGEYVLVHVGYALHTISEDEARRTLAMFDEAELLEEFEGGGSS